MGNVIEQVNVGKIGGMMLGRTLKILPDLEYMSEGYLTVVGDWKKQGREYSRLGKMAVPVIGLILLIVLPALVLVFFSNISLLIGGTATGVLLGASAILSWMAVDRIRRSISLYHFFAGNKTKSVVKEIKEMLDSPEVGESNEILLVHKEKCLRVAVDHGKGIEQSSLCNSIIASSIIIEAFRDLAYDAECYLPGVLSEALKEVDKVQQISKH